MQKLFGEFIEEFPPEQDSLEMSFTPSSFPIKQRWRSNRLSAHFIADYFTNFLPITEDDPDQERRIKERKGAISYVANELLENAMKYHDERSKNKVRFGVCFLEAPSDVTAVLYTSNNLKEVSLGKLEDFVTELLSSNPDEMYIRQVERSVEEGSEASGVGLLTMINDYSAKIGWKLDITETESPIIIVTTMAQIKV